MSIFIHYLFKLFTTVMKKNTIVVVGSVNMDMVANVRSFPRSGETIFGTRFNMFPGGKGANQAVCAAKLGSLVQFIGKIGADVLGERLRKSMSNDGVRLQHLMTDQSTSTGIALITVDRFGQNQIIVVSGSNMCVSPDDMKNKRSVFASAAVVLAQLETPLEAVTKAMAIGRQCGAITILNPAPAQTLPKKLLAMIDYLTPNETEAEILTGIRVRSLISAERAGRKLLKIGVKKVIITLGVRGCMLLTNDVVEMFPAYKVKAIDTTAAGDAFSGALAFSLAQGKAIH